MPQVSKVARFRAPRHPPAQETRLRYAVMRFFDAFHEASIPAILDEEDEDFPPDEKARRRKLLYVLLWNIAQDLLTRDYLPTTISTIGNALAREALKQLAEVVEVPPEETPALRALSDEFAMEMTALVNKHIRKTLEDIETVLNSPEREEEDFDLDAEISIVTNENTAQAIFSSSLLFGLAFGEMVKSTQISAGISQYIWITQNDERVRPAHAELEGVVSSWSDPPLKADKSSNHKDNHPSGDYNCRCSASPVV